jgi:hypothetical protein
MSDTRILLWFTWFLASHWLQRLAIRSRRPATIVDEG